MKNIKHIAPTGRQKLRLQNMITPEQISKKAARFYPKHLANIVSGDESFPWEVQFGKIKTTEDYNTIRKHVDLLMKNSKETRGYGYVVKSKTHHTRKYHVQSLPENIYFETEDDYLQYIGKVTEVQRFRDNVKLIKKDLPQLHEWVLSNPMKIIQNEDDWEGLARVCRYFINNPRPNLYIRELPIEIHTKFIEGHKGILKSLLDYILPDEALNKEHSQFEKRYYLKYEVPVIRLRLLDNKIRGEYTPLTDITMPLSEFGKLDFDTYKIIITENKMNFLTLPDIEQCIAIWGKGVSALLLKDVKWLKEAKIVYWGDMDIQGFRILSQVREYFPQTVSLMMDQDTYETYKMFSVQGTPEEIIKTLNLTKGESELYQYLYKNNLRLEQEKIDHVHAVRKLMVHYNMSF